MVNDYVFSSDSAHAYDYIIFEICTRIRSSELWNYVLSKRYFYILTKTIPRRNVPFTKLIKLQSYHHIETSQLICSAIQLTGFYMMATLRFNELSRIIYPQNCHPLFSEVDTNSPKIESIFTPFSSKLVSSVRSGR